MLRRVAVVGASLGGVSAADKLRSLGYDGELVLIGAEPVLPYDRPPLSKQLLADDGRETATLLRPAQHYNDLDIELCLGAPARTLDLRSQCIELATGRCYRFDGLVLTCGAQPRTLRTAEGLAGVHVLRTMEDCTRLRAALRTASDVVVIGAGLIGSEVASTARTLGLSVTLIEAGPAPMAGVVGPLVGRYCAALHRDHGVELRLGSGVSGFVGSDRVEAVRLADESLIPADVVVLGIGAEPSTGWLQGSGLTLNDGIVCDEHCRAAPNIYAAGDVARWHDPTHGKACRAEHWTNAIEQGETVAENLLGRRRRYASDGYFWSDQFGHKIQFAGYTSPSCSERIFQQCGQRRRLLALYGKAGRLSGAVAFDWPAMLIACRRLIASETTWERAQSVIAEAVSEPVLH